MHVSQRVQLQSTAVDTTGVACRFRNYMAFIVLLLDIMTIVTIQLPFLSEPLLAAGVCKYTVHDDDVQWDVVKENWDNLSIKEKDRQAGVPQ